MTPEMTLIALLVFGTIGWYRIKKPPHKHLLLTILALILLTLLSHFALQHFTQKTDNPTEKGEKK